VKYVIVIPDGAADYPLDELGGLTPFQAAQTPNLDKIAQVGRLGTANTTPPGFEAGSDVCSMCLLGYDPQKYHTGRAPLEAAAIGLDPGPKDWIFRLNLVTTEGLEPGARMMDHSAGAITDREARVLVADLVAHWQRTMPDVVQGFTLTPGVSYRNILVDASGRDYARLTTTPPHAIPGEPWQKHLPTGCPEAELIKRLMLSSAEFLPSQAVNNARAEAGLRQATMAWVWGQGTRPRMPSFKKLHGLRGAMITAVDLLAGIAAYMGWDRLNVPGITSYHDTDYAAQGRATCDAIDDYDVVCCHVEAPDEASHQGDAATKVASLESIDRHVLAPIMQKLATFGDPEKDPSAKGWRILVMPDHYTRVSTRRHDPTPVPFAMAGAWVRSLVKRPFSEENAEDSDLHIDPGHDLMEYFLRGGLAKVRS